MNMNSKDICPVILAGGFGTRLQARVSDRPKALAPVRDKPFLDYVLEWLRIQGFSKAVLALGYKAGMIENHYRNRSTGLDLKFAHEDTPLDTGGGARNGAQLADSSQILVLNADSMVDCLLEGMQKHHHRLATSPGQDNDNTTLLLVPVEDRARYGQVEQSNDGKITRFLEKDGKHEPGLINAGIYLMPRQTLLDRPPGSRFSLEKDVFPQLVQEGKLHGHTETCNFIDIGTPESYDVADKFLESLTIIQA